MKREKRLTKRERKTVTGPGPGPRPRNHQEQHIHCVACGRHLDPSQFDAPASAMVIQCLHGSNFPSCVGCQDMTKVLLAEHDRTGEAVKSAAAWH